MPLSFQLPKLRCLPAGFIKYVGFALFILAAAPVSAQGFLHAENEKIVDGNGNNVLLKGIGLGGWMLQEGYMLRVNGIGQQQHVIKAHITALVGEEKATAFYTAWLNNHTTKADIDALKSWGFNSVRLPMHYNLFTLPVEDEKIKGQHTWLTKGFELTDSLLTWCRQNEMYLILDMHATPGGQGNDLNISDADTTKPFLWESSENQQKLIALWRKLAERYQNETWIGAYDLINEPNWGFADKTDRNGLREKGNEPLRRLMMDISKAIREVDKNHLLIIEGNGWGNNYHGILPAWDNNMALSFHKYWNFNDLGSIQQFLNFRSTYQMPVWLGESGENSNVWFTEAIRLMEQNNIGWCWWPLKKLGANNPLEIKSNKAYEEVLAFWSGKGPQPSAQRAFEGLMKLAESTRFSENIQHTDVVDAMIRQPGHQETKAFADNIIQTGFLLPAVNYDLGANGLAYFDTDTADYHISNNKRGGNRGRMFRNDGVDIEKDDISWYINHIEAGEWLQYSLQVPETATYTLEFSVWAPKTEGFISIALNDQQLSPGLNQLKIESGDGWQLLQLPGVVLEKGWQKLRVHFPVAGANFRSTRFIKQ